MEDEANHQSYKTASNVWATLTHTAHIRSSLVDLPISARTWKHYDNMNTIQILLKEREAEILLSILTSQSSLMSDANTERPTVSPISPCPNP